jgi:hypothetical protein
MKKIFYGLLLLSMITLWSCEKSTIDESPGNISGMGVNPNELQIKEYITLPEGIYLVDSYTEINNIDASLPRFGSGPSHLKINLFNPTDIPITVFFPKGLIWKCNSPDNHNLILLQTCWVSLKPNVVKTFILDAYSINLAKKHQADAGITFEILGLSGSQVINKLLDLVDWRKINYEMITGSSSDEKTNAYLDLMEPLQDIVWNLTDNGIDITDEDIKFIKGIRELSASEIPQKNYLGQFPGYFDEFMAKGN